MTPLASSLEAVQLETPRLVMRLPRPDDLDRWAELMADAEAARFIGGPMPRTITWRMIMTIIGAWHACGFSMFSVIEKSTGLWVGRVGPWQPEGWPGPEIGWAITRDRWGRGYATESAAAAADWAFERLGWTRMIHVIAPQNAASRRVAERIGSGNLGPGRLPPPYQENEVDIWGQSRDAWRARPGRSGR